MRTLGELMDRIETEKHAGIKFLITLQCQWKKKCEARATGPSLSSTRRFFSPRVSKAARGSPPSPSPLSRRCLVSRLRRDPWHGGCFSADETAFRVYQSMNRRAMKLDKSFSWRFGNLVRVAGRVAGFLSRNVNWCVD